MNKQEHLKWAKERAFTYINEGNALKAWISFLSDLSKHEELKNHIAIDLGKKILDLNNPSLYEIRKFIDGFN